MSVFKSSPVTKYRFYESANELGVWVQPRPQHDPLDRHQCFQGGAQATPAHSQQQCNQGHSAGALRRYIAYNFNDPTKTYKKFL